MAALHLPKNLAHHVDHLLRALPVLTLGRLARVIDGDVDGPAFWSDLPEMEDTGWHSMLVHVSAPHVYVEIDGIPYMDTNVSGFFGFPAYIGFTAGTGGATNAHLIDSLIVTETACVEE